MDCLTRLDHYARSVELALEQYVPNVPVAQGRLIDAMQYSLFAGGKRIRPALLLEFCRINGGSVEAAMPFACALEMIHTYSLIHDDLPCMDDDDLRRGRPSNHKVFGQATAVLAGDALLTAAFETMLDPDNLKKLDPACALKAAYIIAYSSGAYGMVGGQQMDIDAEGAGIDFQTAALIHSMKTGALFCAAAEAGCVLAGAGLTEINHAVSYANFLGLVFQIQDDILDATGDSAVMGKNIGTDAETDKQTFVRILGIERCGGLVESFSKDAVSYLKPFQDIEFLSWLTDFLSKRKH